MSESNTALTPDAAQDKQKKDILSQARSFFGTALSPLKGRDVNQLMEEFTSEMTLVAEGLSEDQARLSRLLDNVASQQTIFENDTEMKLRELKSSVEENAGRIENLTGELSRMQKSMAVRNQKTKKADGWTGFLRQATWLVSIAAGAWIIVTLVNKLF